MSEKHTPAAMLAAAEEVMEHPHPSHCDHLHDAAALLRWGAAEVERLTAERRKVEALEKALRMLHAICRDCDLETEADRPTEEQYTAAMDAAEAALTATEGGE